MVRIRLAVALLLLLVLFPGAGEALENAAHLIGFGHLAHASGTQDPHGPGGTEHGCAGTFHLCTCCPSAAGELIWTGGAAAPERHSHPPLVAFVGAAEASPRLVERPPRA